MGKIDFGKFEGISRLALEEIERRLVKLEGQKKPVQSPAQKSQEIDTNALFRMLSPKFYDLLLAKYPWLKQKIGGGDLESLYPVGTVYLSVLDVDPATLFDFGTWEKL